MNETNKKRLKTTASATLAAALLVTGSLAWRDVSQHKTNKFKTKSVSQSMVLVEKFKDKENWIPGEAVQKEVYVRNGQDTDDTGQYVYSDGYVRIQLREFLGKMEENIEWTDARYLIDTDGNHVKATTHAGAKAAALAMGYTVDDSQIYQVSTPMDGIDASNPGNGGYAVSADTNVSVVQHEGTFSADKGYYYVRTDDKAPNGIYGKFIMITNEAKNNLTNFVDGSAVNLTDLDKDQEVRANNQTPGHNNDNSNSTVQNAEDQTPFSIHSWNSSDPTTVKISNEIKIDLGSKVQYLSKWNGEPGKFWILDDSNDNGYAYWGERLNHSTTGSVSNNSMTEKLIETVTLLNKSDQLVYRLHINMDAVSPSDLVGTNGWGTPGTDFPQKIKDAYAAEETILNSKAALKELITRAEKLVQSNYTPTSWTAFSTKLTAAKAVAAKANPTAAEIALAKTELETAMKSLVSTAIRTALAAEIAKAEALRSIDYTPASWTTLQAELTKAKAVNDDKAAIQAEVDAALAELKDIITALQPSSLATAIQQLKNVIANAKTEIATGKYIPAGVTALQTIVDNADTLIASNPTNESDVVAMISNINDGISNLVEKTLPTIPGLTNPQVGEKFSMNGINYTIVAKDQENYLVLADRLTVAQLSKMGFSSAEGGLKYGKPGETTFTGYENSNLKLIDDKFYSEYVVGSEYEPLVQKISFTEEVLDVDNWNTRADSPTLLSSSGQARAVSLSVSDVNKYNLSSYFTDSTYTQSVMLRSIGATNNTIVKLTFKGEISGSELSDGRNHIRPAMWLDLSQQ